MKKHVHKWEGHKKGIKTCSNCGIEKWLSNVYHIKPGNPLFSPNRDGVCVWNKEPPCFFKR